MRLAERNLRTFYYCNYVGRTEIDENGNPIAAGSTTMGTGEFVDTYTTPTALVGHIGGITGAAKENPFGISDDYDRTIIVEDTSCSITSTSLLFIDKAPATLPDGTPDFDYYVVKAGCNLGYFYILAKKKK